MGRNLPGKQSITVHHDLSPAYFDALARLPEMVSSTFTRSWDECHLLCALSAVAASKGNTPVAEAIMEMTCDVPSTVLDWLFSQ